MAEQTIKLSYDTANQTFTSEPPTVVLNVGDTVLFVSDQGPVNIKFDPPECFAAEQIVGGTVQVRIVKRAPARMPCGITINGATVGFPDHERFGPAGDPAK
jgi:hypothetical protein